MNKPIFPIKSWRTKVWICVGLGALLTKVIVVGVNKYRYDIEDNLIGNKLLFGCRILRILPEI